METQKNLNILLADDHELVRDALDLLLQRDFDNPEISLASNFEQVLSILERQEDLDIVISDLFMPGVTGLSSIKTLIEKAQGVPVVIISGHLNRQDIQAAYELGIRGYIPKTTTGKALTNILRLVLSGERYVSEIYLNSAEEQLIVPSTGAKLTAREIEVLNGLLKGLSNKQISASLFIEETTVKLHLRSLFEKLEAKNRTDAVIKAMKYGLANTFS